MEPTDPEQGQEPPPEQDVDPGLSCRGRQRKKNSKYSDFETSLTPSPRKPRRSLRGARTPSRVTRDSSEDAERPAPQAADAEIQVTDPDWNTQEQTPKKAARARRTPSRRASAKKTPGQKSVAVSTTLSADPPHEPGENGGGALDGAQLENGATPKPKRKYVRRQKPVPEPAREEVEPEKEEEEGAEPGGRRRRGAAKMALKYLQTLANEVLSHSNDEEQQEAEDKRRTGSKEEKAHRGKKRRRDDTDSENDEDFVPDADEEEAQEVDDDDDEDEAEEEADSDFEMNCRKAGKGSRGSHVRRSYTVSVTKSGNGLSRGIMKPVWRSFHNTLNYREKHFSSWLFPEWLPSADHWKLVEQSEVDQYLPQELQSAEFSVFREGLKEEAPSQRLNRFQALAAHPQRWDTALFAGGPVWSMEWCPTPDGAPAAQHLALACYGGMDERHRYNRTYAGPGLVQLWDLGRLDYNSSPDSRPRLAYALAQDKGFIRNMKWCPAGGWELPDSAGKAPLLPRLGLLAVALSSGVVSVYSLPHPDALRRSKPLRPSGPTEQPLPVYKTEGVVTLRPGALKAPRRDGSGQILCMDWLCTKPHSIVAAGFYDGTVALWNLSSDSSLLKAREPDGSLSLLPYRCFLAHDHAVRALALCPVSRNLLVTAGEDRLVKSWDLRRLDDPVTVQRRFLTNEVYWPVDAAGVLMAQEAGYVTKNLHGVHYFDLYMQNVFAVPRSGTVWSISFSDWLNSLVTSDSFGEVILSVLPQINFTSVYVKRSLDRRFPLYLTSLVPRAPDEDDKRQEDGGAAEEEEEQEADEPPPASARGGDLQQEGEGAGGGANPPPRLQTYQEAVKKFSLQHTDCDMTSFVGVERRPSWIHMKNTELNSKINHDDLPLGALHKIRFSPNMCSHSWVASGGQTGLVRIHCLRGLLNPDIKKTICSSQARFRTRYCPEEAGQEEEGAGQEEEAQQQEEQQEEEEEPL